MSSTNPPDTKEAYRKRVGARLLLIPLIALHIAGCAAEPVTDSASNIATKNNTKSAAENVTTTVTGERLIASPPPSWDLIYQINNAKTRISDFVPQGESELDWETQLSFQSHVAADIPLDPVTLLMSEAESDKNHCDEVRDFNVFSGYENNYETSVRLYLCSKNGYTKKGEIKLIKAIRAEQFIYSVRLTRRIDPFDVKSFNKDQSNDEQTGSEQPSNKKTSIAAEEVAVWSNYMKKISVCDDTADHPCPESEELR